MAKLLDLEEIQKVIDDRKAILADSIGGNTEQAVIARHEYEVAMANTLWRSKEINRQSNPTHIIKAMMIGAVAGITGHIMQDVAPDKRPFAAIGICEEMLADMLKIIMATDEERAGYSRIVKPTDGGSA